MKTSRHFLALGFFLCLFRPGAMAADITVTSQSDSGAGSLRQAFVTAAASGGADRIIFDASVFTVASHTITLLSEIVVSDADGVTVDASALAYGVTISGGGAKRLFSVAGGGNLTLHSLTLTGGNGTGAAASGNGGALYVAGNATIESCTLSGNSVTGQGGAIRNDGTLTLTQCTVSGNTSGDSGGGIVNSGASPLSLTHCTIAANTATNSGGGIMISTGLVTVKNSIVSGNLAANGPDVWSAGAAGGITRVGVNIIRLAGKLDDAVDNGPAAITADPLLGTLTDNGGPTQTIALLAYSHAIDAVPADAIVAGLDSDQRGFARSLGGGPDLGAYESGDASFTADGLTLYARLTAAQIAMGGFFEISDNANFIVDPALVSTLAGVATDDGFTDGPRQSAEFNFPSGVAQDSQGNIFIADTANNVIRMLGPDGVVSTIAGTGTYGTGTGPGLSAALSFPSGIAVGPDDNVYVSDTYSHRVCKLTRPVSAGQEWTVTTLAGTGIAGYQNGAGSVAKFNYPYGLDLDASGNVYVTDSLNHRIRKVTPAGAVSTFAGPTGVVSGTADFVDSVNPSDARFNTPQGLVISGSSVYVADRLNNRIRKIATTPDVSGLLAGEVSTLAGDGMITVFQSPSSLAASSDGTRLYVADEDNHRIRQVTLTPMPVISTVAGTGTAGFANGISTAAMFNAPTGLLVARDGTLVVADSENHMLRSIAIGPLRVTPIPDPTNINSAGQQVGAVLNLELLGLSSNVLYYFRYRLSDTSMVFLGQGQSFTQVDLPVVVTVAADRLTPMTARLNGTVNPNNRLTSAVLEYSTEPDLQAPYAVTKLAGTGVAGFGDSPNARFSSPEGLAVSGGSVYVADFLNHRIRRIDPSGDVSTFAGSGVAGFLDGTGAAAKFDRPSGIVAEPDVTISDCATVFGTAVVTCASTAALVPGMSVSGKNIAARTTIASITDGTHFVLSLNATGTSSGLTLTAGGANFYVADEFNHCIRKISASGVVTVFAGTPSVAGFADGAVDTARFLYPMGVALDSAVPPNVYVADKGNHSIRKVAPDGTVSTFSGTGVSGFGDGLAATAQFASPRGIAVNPSGDVLVADTGNHLIRKISGGNVSTFAGSTQGFLDGPDVTAQFDTPSGIAVDADGVSFVTDSSNHRIRRIAADGAVTTHAGSGIAGAVNSPSPGLYPVNAAQFNLPIGVAVDGAGGVFVTQEGLVRKIARIPLPTLVWPTTLTGTATQAIAGDTSGLLPGTTYYFRARGTCPEATVTGEILSFTTPTAPITVSAGPSIAGTEVLNGQAVPVDFGATPLGTPAAQSFTISNPNGRSLTVSSINVPAGYQVTAGAGLNVIIPGGTLTFEVTLLATGGGTVSGNVVIQSDAPGLAAFTFPVTGVVLAPPAVTTLAATANGAGSATLNGTVNPLGSDTDVWFQWSLTGQFDGVDTSTLAGSSTGDVDGTGAAVKFNQPFGLVADEFGNIFVADTQNHRIRKITLTTDGSGNVTGSVVSFAGTGVAGFADGPGATAQFNKPAGLAIDADGTLYVADSGNHLIRAITPGGEVRIYSGSPLLEASFTDGVGIAARFSTPWGLAIDADGTLYVADRNNHRIRKVALDGSVSTLAGTGTAGTTNGAGDVAQFNQPQGIGVDGAGFVYVTEATSHAIRKIAADGVTTTPIGSVGTSGFVNGTNGNARFSSPVGIAVDGGGTIYVADKNNHSVRKITSTVGAGGAVTASVVTYAGLGAAGTDNGLKDVARFDSPISVLAAGDAGVFVGELTNSTIRRLVPTEPLLAAATGLTGTSVLPVQLTVTGLTIGTTYHYRIVASNARGTTFGGALSIRAGTPFQIWQAEEFGADAEDPFIAGPDAAPAGDGISNLIKYALGLEPLVNAAGSLPVASINGGMLSLVYTQVVAATDINYTPEWSSDLVTWNTAGITEQFFPPTGPTRQAIALIPIAPHTAKFMRLTITFK